MKNVITVKVNGDQVDRSTLSKKTIRSMKRLTFIARFSKTVLAVGDVFFVGFLIGLGAALLALIAVNGSAAMAVLCLAVAFFCVDRACTSMGKIAKDSLQRRAETLIDEALEDFVEMAMKKQSDEGQPREP